MPPLGVFKINVDGATSENDRNSSVGVVIRDATVQFMLLAVNIFRDNTRWRKSKR